MQVSAGVKYATYTAQYDNFIMFCYACENQRGNHISTCTSNTAKVTKMAYWDFGQASESVTVFCCEGKAGDIYDIKLASPDSGHPADAVYIVPIN